MNKQVDIANNNNQHATTPNSSGRSAQWSLSPIPGLSPGQAPCARASTPTTPRGGTLLERGCNQAKQALNAPKMAPNSPCLRLRDCPPLPFQAVDWGHQNSNRMLQAPHELHHVSRAMKAMNGPGPSCFVAERMRILLVWGPVVPRYAPSIPLGPVSSHFGSHFGDIVYARPWNRKLPIPRARRPGSQSRGHLCPV